MSLYGAAQSITINNYTGSAEEAYLWSAPNGEIYLLFDDRNDPDTQVGLPESVWMARRIDDITFDTPVKISALSGGQGAVVWDIVGDTIYFPGLLAAPDYNVSWRGKWDGAGGITNMEPVPGLGVGRPGAFQAIGKQGISRSPGPGYLYTVTVNGETQTCQQGIGWMDARGTVTAVWPIDTADAANQPPGVMTGAPIFSRNFSEAYVTREDTRPGSFSLRILMTTHDQISNTYGVPELIADGAEGPFLSNDDQLLYYHRPKAFPDGQVRFEICVRRRI